MGAAPCLKHPNNTGRYPKIDRGRGEGCRGFSQKKNTTATYLRHTAERQGNGAPWPRGHHLCQTRLLANPSKSLVLLLMCRCPPGSKFQPKKYTHTTYYGRLLCTRMDMLDLSSPTAPGGHRTNKDEHGKRQHQRQTLPPSSPGVQQQGGAGGRRDPGHPGLCSPRPGGADEGAARQAGTHGERAGPRVRPRPCSASLRSCCIVRFYRHGSMSVHGYCRGFGLFGDLVLSVAFYSFWLLPLLHSSWR